MWLLGVVTRVVARVGKLLNISDFQLLSLALKSVKQNHFFEPGLNIIYHMVVIIIMLEN